MEILSPWQAVQLLDALACALLAGASACRASRLGAHFTGAMLLGCLCGLAGPLLREVAANGPPGARIALAGLADDAFIGALGALAAIRLLGERSRSLFLWLDSAGMGLESCLGAVMSLPGSGAVAALTLGCLSGLGPGLLRDVALGDTAMLVDRRWYGACAPIGCALSLSLLTAFFLWPAPGFLRDRGGEISILAGAALVIGLRIWKRRESMD